MARRKTNTRRKKKPAIQEEIHRLECFIASAPYAARSQKFQERHQLSAPSQKERGNRIRHANRMTRSQEATMRRERSKHLVAFLFLICVLFLVSYWIVNLAATNL